LARIFLARIFFLIKLFSLQLGILFLLPLAVFIEVQGSNSPYLDDSGYLCQDKLETVQDTEYETMIQCRVAMKKSCKTENDAILTALQPKSGGSAEACHTVYEKKCKTVYRPHSNKVRKINVKSSTPTVWNVLFLQFNCRVKVHIFQLFSPYIYTTNHVVVKGLFKYTFKK
jgi:hypothetical protein